MDCTSSLKLPTMEFVNVNEWGNHDSISEFTSSEALLSFLSFGNRIKLNEDL